MTGQHNRPAWSDRGRAGNEHDASRPLVVLLGASNLTRGISTVVRTARAAVGRPADFLIANGHGRSYGKWSVFAGRGIPGILECRLWEALDHLRDGRPVRALITDVGNDVMYGVEPERIVEWVGECIRRLRRSDDAVVAVTALPSGSLERLGPARYRIVRRLFFPTNTMPYEEALRRAIELARLVPEVARCEGATVVEQDGRWYGVDPIHIRLKYWPEAWSRFMAPWVQSDVPVDHLAPSGDAHVANTDWRLFARVRLATPDHRRVLGVQQTRAQPAVTLPDGTRLGYY